MENMIPETKTFTVELGQAAYIWLEHISQATNTPVEELIAGAVYSHVAALEDSAYKAFGVHEA